MLFKQRHFLIAFLTIFGLLAYPVCANFCPADGPCCEKGCSKCELASQNCQQDIDRLETVTLDPPVFVCPALLKVEIISSRASGFLVELFFPTAGLALNIMGHPHTGPPTA